MKPSDPSDRQSVVTPTPEKAFGFDALDTVLRHPDGSLDSDIESTRAIIDADKLRVDSMLSAQNSARNRWRLLRFAVLGMVLIIGFGVIGLRHNITSSKQAARASQLDASQRYPNTSIPLANIDSGAGLSVQNNQTLSINGQLNVNNTLVLTPTASPSNPVSGQLYFNRSSSLLAYYNGTRFVDVTGATPVPTPTSIGGLSGAIAVGNGISVAGNRLSNTGVLSLQGQAGNVTLAGGPGLVVNGTTLSNSGLLSLGGQNGDIAVGAGLSASGGNLRNTGIISAIGAGTITVTNDGNGNIVIDGPNGGSGGTVASPGGTINKIAKFTGVQTIADSLLTDNGTTLTVGGALHVTGAISFDVPLTVTNGGTGATSAPSARTNLGAAASGANGDITSLTGLTTFLSVNQGGTGVGTLPTNSVLVGNGTSAIGAVTGSNGQCLIMNSGAPSFATCPGSGGVTSVNNLTGAITIAGTSSAGSTITINDATSGSKGIASFNATNFLVSSGSVNTIQNIAVTSTPTFASLTLSNPLTVANGGTGRNNLTSDGVIIGNGSSAVTSATGSSGQCLVVSGTTPNFQTCPGSGGVTTVNAANGAITIQGTAGSSISTVGGVITISDASTTTKGLASFNATNFASSSGAINTVQDIATNSAPSFGQLSIVSNQATGKMLTVNNTNAASTGNLLDLQLNGVSKLSVSPNGSLVSAGNLSVAGNVTSGLVNGQTISSNASFTGSLDVAGTLAVNTIANTNALTVGVGGQSFTLQGNTSSQIISTNGSNTTTVAFQSPTANVTYNFGAATAGTYTVCTTVGNCAGVGGGVTSAGGTTNKLSKFTGSNTIGDSILTDNGSTVTIAGALSVNTITPTGSLTVGATGQNLTLQGSAVTLSSTAAGIATSLVFATPATSNKTITLPNATGTVAVSASGPLVLDSFGNLTCPTCLSGGGGGAGVSSLNGLTGALTLQGSDAASFSNAGTTVTVSDASSTVKGLAKFNSTNLTVTSGSVNTIQNIAVTSAPTFAGLTLTSALTVGNGGTGATSAAGARTNLGAAASGANSDITSLSGLTTALSIAQGGTGVTTTPTNGQILIGNGTGYSLNTLTAGSGINISNTSGTITISAPGSGTCATCANTALSNLASVAINTSLLPGTAGAADLGSGTLPFGQLFLSGTSASPATNNFKITGASTSGTRTIALPDASGTVAVSASGYLNLSGTGNLTFSGTLAVADGGTGSNTAAGARTNLSAAKSGANSDITSLSGLTTALSVGQGGTGLSALTANQLLFASSTSTIGQLTNGSSGLCLVSNGAGLSPSFQTCTGAGGVSSVDGLTGALTISNTTGAGATITIDNAKADGTTKGIATFNATNFTDNGSGLINTIQGIATTSTPTFAGINTNSIAPSAALTLGATTQSFTLQGSATSTITATGGGFTSTVGFSGTPTGAVRYNFDRAAAAGTYTVCSTAGNCVGIGGGVTTAGGTTGQIAKFTGSGTIGDSILSEASGTVTVQGALKVNGTSNFASDVTIQNSVSNTGNTLQVLQTGGLNVLNVDTNNSRVGIGAGAAAPSATLQVAGTANISGGAVNINTSGTASTTIGNTSGTLNLTSQTFTLQGGATSTLVATGGGFNTTIGFSGTPTGAVTYNFDRAATAGTYTVCTTVGNCAGVGGGVTSAGGTTNKLSKFTGSNTIGDSILTDNGSTVTIAGALSVNTITPTGSLTVGATGQNLTLQGSAVTLSSTAAGIATSLVFATPATSNKTITLPNATGTVAVSASGPLVLDSFGNLTCPTCLSGGGGGAGVSSLNGLTGALTLQGSDAASFSNAGTTVTVSDASSTVKGLAKFNSTNLTVTSGSVNTIQNIAVTSAPTFAGLTLTSALTVGNGGTGATSAAGARTNLGAAASGANSDITSLSGLTTALSIAQGGTGVTTTPTNGQILIGNGTGYSLNTLTAGSGINISNTSGTITISAPGSGTCATCANTALSNLASVAINTSLLPGTAGAADLGSGTLPFGQLFLSGTSASPATNNFKITGASTSGTRTIALPDASGTVAVSASGYLNLSGTGNLTFSGTLAVADGGTGSNTAAGARTNLSAAKSGANSDITSLSGLTTALSVGQGGTGLSALTANQLLFASSTSTIGQLTNGSSGLCLVSNGAGLSPSFQTCTGAGGVSSVDGLTGALTISNTTGAGATITIDNAKADGTTKGIATFNATNFTDNGSGLINTIQGIATTSTPTFAGINTNSIAPSAALTLGATTQSFTLQGSATSTITATGGGFTSTIGFSGTPTGAVRYNFDRAAAAGTYTVCSTAGNCVGIGGGVTTAGGTTGQIAKFTGSGTIGDSILSEASGTVTVAGNLNLTTGNTFQINGTQITSSALSNDNNLAKLNANQTFTGTNAVKVTSATAFSVQNASATPIFTVDTASSTATIAGTVNAVSGYKFNGTAGATTTCSGGQFLQNQVVQGGIVTGGACAAVSGGTGVTTIGALDGGTANANGATISGTTLYLQSASSSFAGLVNTVSQTFAGNKTFTGQVLTDSLDTATSGGTLGIGTATTTANITLGSSTSTGTLTLGQSTASNTINIGNANTATGNTQTINIGAGTPAGTGNTVITIGNTQGTSSTTIQAGTGDLTLTSGQSVHVRPDTNSNTRTGFDVYGKGGSPLLVTDSVAIGYISFPNIDDGVSGASALNITNGWSSAGSATVSYDTTRSYDGLASLLVGMPASTTAGFTANFNANPPGVGNYNFSFYARLGSGTMASNLFKVTMGAANTTCNSGVTLNSTTWQLITCPALFVSGTFTSVSVTQTTAVARNLYVDATDLSTNQYNNFYAPGYMYLMGRIASPVIISPLNNGASSLGVYTSNGTSVFNVDTNNNKFGTADESNTSMASGDVNLQSGNSVGPTSNSGNVSIDVGTATSTAGSITLGGSNAVNITLGSTSGVGTLTLGRSTGSNTINIGNANTATGNTQTINIGAGTPAGTGKAVVTIGNTVGASSVAINAGTGGISLGANTTVASAKTFTVNGSAIIGAAPGSGSLTNNGSTTNSTLALTDFTTGGSIGSAATTVDIYTAISVAQTTASQTLTIPTPTASTTYGRILYLSNVGTTSFTLLGTPLKPGATASLIWNNTNGGASWQYAGADGNSILNQNGSAQTGVYWITGAARSDTSVLTPVVDAATAGSLSIGTGATSTSLVLGGTATTTSSLQATTNLNIGTTASNKTITIGASGTVNNTTAINIGNTTSTGGASTIQIGGTGVTNGSNTGTAVTLQAGQTVSTLTNSGATVKTFTNSTTAFQVQNSIGTALLDVDTTNKLINLYDTLAQTLSVQDGNGIYSNAYYDRSTSTDRYRGAGAASQIYTDFNGMHYLVGVSGGSAGAAVSFTEVMNLSVSNGAAWFKNNTNSTTGFQIQNASGTALFALNTSTGGITFGTGSNTVIFTPSGGLVASGTARHIKNISLSAEYAGAVLYGGDTGGANCSTNQNGSMTSGLDTGSTQMSYYNWTSSQATNQCYDVAVRIPIPTGFSSWSGAPTIQIKTDNTTNSTYAIGIIKSDGTTYDSSYGSAYTSPGTLTTSWASMSTSSLDSSGYTAGGYMTIRIRMTAKSNANLQLGDITLPYNSIY